MDFLHFLEYLGIALAAGAVIGFCVVGPVGALIMWLYGERQQAKIPGTRQYHAEMDKQVMKAAAFERQNIMTHTYSYGLPKQVPSSQFGIDLLDKLVNQALYLQDLFTGLDQFKQRKAFRRVLLRGKKMKREEIIEAIWQLLPELQGLVDEVINSQRAALSQLEQLHLQLKIAQAEIQWVKDENGRLIYEKQHGTFDGRWMTNEELQQRDEYPVTEWRKTQNALRESERRERDTERRLQTSQAEIEKLNKQKQEGQSQALTEAITLREQIATLEGELGKKGEENEALLNLTLFLRQGELDDEITARFKSSMDELGRAARIGGEKGIKEFKLKSGGIDTLYYSYSPQLLMYALRRLGSPDHFYSIETVKDQDALRRRKVLPINILYGFAGVLGFINLYRYLGQLPPDHHFLQALLNLSLPPFYVEKLADSLDAASWLVDVRHFPSEGREPIDASSFTLVSGASSTNAERAIAQTIITSEKRRLLDFRTDLFVAVSKYALLTQEEEEQQEQALLATALQQGPHQFRFIEYIHREPTLGDGVHVIKYEYRDPYVSKPIEAELAFNNAGKVLTEIDEDE